VRGLKIFALLVILSATCIYLWCVLSGPMLVRIPNAMFIGDYRFMIPNPLRQRGPEKYSTLSLAEIQSSACKSGMTKFKIPDDQKTAACRKQELDPLMPPCKLVDRSDKNASVWILFQCPYKRATEARAQVALTVTKQGGQYTLQNYERIY